MKHVYPRLRPTYPRRSAPGGDERGSTLVVLLGLVVVCAGMSSAVLTTNMGRQRDANSNMHRERAFQLAEAGVDWGIAEVRKRNGLLTGLTETLLTVSEAGSFRVRFAYGDTDGRDNDGDGVVDNAAERNYAVLTSTGVSGGVRRTIEVVVRRAVEVPDFASALQFNAESSLLDLEGNAFRISGLEHDAAGNVVVGAPAKPGIASTADVAEVVAQIPLNRQTNVTGLGGTPSVAQSDPVDLAQVVAQAQSAATVVLEPGTHDGRLTLGTATTGGTQVVYTQGDLYLSGGGGGAGVLVVDGDLTISGGFEWVGIVIVSGRLNLEGGGGGKRLIGALAVGDEVRITGTVDVLNSSQAVELASEQLAVMTVLSWQEVGAGAP
jgi:hypothetical protein